MKLIQLARSKVTVYVLLNLNLKQKKYYKYDTNFSALDKNTRSQTALSVVDSTVRKITMSRRHQVWNATLSFTFLRFRLKKSGSRSTYDC